MDAPVSKADLAEKYFKEGANCSQAVLAAFADDLGITEEFAMRLASGFGGGIGRMREVCGAFSALVMIDDLRNASGDHTDKASKDERYNRIRALAEEFSAASGGNSIICRELLENPPADPKPSPRTEAYYKDRPCARFVYVAASVLEDYIEAHKI